MSGERVEYWLGESIGVWDREANTLSTALNVYDYVNPWDDWVDAPNSYTTSNYFCSAKRTEVSALDWSHASSVTLGSGGEYVVSLRNLNAVLCFHANASGLAWTLSPSLATSDFTFATRNDRFYNPHVPILRDATHLLLMDDGNNRPNCTNSVATCYSRAVELELDFDRKRAAVVWSFSFPDNFAASDTSAPGSHRDVARLEKRDVWQLDGGNIIPLDADANHTIVAFTGTDPSRDDVFVNVSLVFELERGLTERGSMRAAMTLPRPSWDSGSYRAIPYLSVYGETSASPFGGGIVGDASLPVAGR